jgi:hypothetical protein
MRRKGKQSALQNLALDDCSTHLISSPPQPLTGRNQAPGIVLLFSHAGRAVHDAHGEGRHRGVESGHLRKELPIFPDHRAVP